MLIHCSFILPSPPLTSRYLKAIDGPTDKPHRISIFAMHEAIQAGRSLSIQSQIVGSTRRHAGRLESRGDARGAWSAQGNPDIRHGESGIHLRVPRCVVGRACGSARRRPIGRDPFQTDAVPFCEMLHPAEIQHLLQHLLQRVGAGARPRAAQMPARSHRIWQAEAELPKTFAQPLQMFLGTARAEVVVPVREFFSLNRAIRGKNSRTGIFHLISLPIRYNIPVR